MNPCPYHLPSYDNFFAVIVTNTLTSQFATTKVQPLSDGRQFMVLSLKKWVVVTMEMVCHNKLGPIIVVRITLIENTKLEIEILLGNTIFLLHLG